MKEKGSQVLPFTLTEVLALLFFVLALALADQIVKRAEADRAAQPLEPLGEENTAALVSMLLEGQEEFPDDFEELVRTVQSVEQSRERMIEVLRREGVPSEVLDSASLQQLVDSIYHRNERMRQASRDLRSQLEYLRDRGDGMDHPPCWPDGSGNPEYAFEVTLHTETVDVSPVWPDHRNDDAARIDGMLQVSGETIPYERFSQDARPILEWSKRQTPECRHFVIVRDSVDGGKEAFKNGLLTVEESFYKYLAN